MAGFFNLAQKMIIARGLRLARDLPEHIRDDPKEDQNGDTYSG
jgi:hypothetical protein